MRLFFPACLFHKVTGLYCPGCGGTRAFLYLIHGHPLLSLWYHPFVIYMVFMLVYYVYSGVKRAVFLKKYPATQKGPGFRTWPLWGALIVIAANCIFKNIILLGGGIDPLP
ncbi:MAG: DUF2752 domain-containing protein [Lachnospiraceae bacterium]|nr:DUF2752 domain-containing protein [Lachnospiraceae bacterium]